MNPGNFGGETSTNVEKVFGRPPESVKKATFSEKKIEKSSIPTMKRGNNGEKQPTLVVCSTENKSGEYEKQKYKKQNLTIEQDYDEDEEECKPEPAGKYYKTSSVVEKEPRFEQQIIENEINYAQEEILEEENASSIQEASELEESLLQQGQLFREDPALLFEGLLDGMKVSAGEALKKLASWQKQLLPILPELEYQQQVFWIQSVKKNFENQGISMSSNGMQFIEETDNKLTSVLRQHRFPLPGGVSYRMRIEICDLCY